MSKHGNGNLPHHNLYINGQWRAPLARAISPTDRPFHGRNAGDDCPGRHRRHPPAIQAARDAFDDGYWSHMEPGERSRLLHALVDAIEARQDEIAEAEMRDGGCTWRKAYLLDIPVGLIHFRHFAKLADFEPLEPVPQITFPALSYNFVRREPIGVCGQIIPWNFPFLMAIWKIAPALATGNTVILKPATFTPLSRSR
jgi:acyl-CoA reductase-like NAD-dependent aldehyde dehydrogenase